MVNVNLVIMGQGRKVIEVPEGTDIETLKNMVELNEGLELRIGGEKITDDYVITQGENIVATLPVKGGF